MTKNKPASVEVAEERDAIAVETLRAADKAASQIFRFKNGEMGWIIPDDEWQDVRQALAKLESLREAAAPFVRHYEKWMDDHDDASEPASYSRVTFGDLRRLRAALATLTPASPEVDPFQQRVQPWLMACFGEMIAGDREERNHRFLEEALELVQACGCTASEAHQLVDYVHGRDIGEPAQEVGGVMVTLAALCLANGLDMHANGETELTRIWTKVEAIRAKQAAKPKHSPLPQATQQPREAIAREALETIAGAYDKWDPDGMYASSALHQASKVAKDAILALAIKPDAGGSDDNTDR